MKIKKVQAYGVHGFMNFDIEFDKALTFLTGINGTGKTTILEIIDSVLSPRLDHLVFLKYDLLNITICESGNQVEIVLRSDDRTLEIECSEFPNDSFVIDKNVISNLSIQELGLELELGKANKIPPQISKLIAGNKILQYIRDLPTPVNLRLENRITSTSHLYNVVNEKETTDDDQQLQGVGIDGTFNQALRLVNSTYTECIRVNQDNDSWLRQNLIRTFVEFLERKLDSNDTNGTEFDENESDGNGKKLQEFLSSVNEFSNETKKELESLIELVKRIQNLEINIDNNKKKF